ncbi:hypothetical protein GQ457_07G045460 [Hibiscus cannabinus]
MSFFVQDPGQIATHLLYKTALALALLRWVLSWLLRSDSQDNSPSSSSSVSSQMIRDSLVLTTLEDAKERVPWVSDTCAVCLSQLKEGDEVRELRNCCHVFHGDCIGRWVEYDGEDDVDSNNHKACPLCRSPLLASSQCWVWPKNEPSWAVQRLLYLFGDDLLP